MRYQFVDWDWLTQILYIIHSIHQYSTSPTIPNSVSHPTLLPFDYHLIAIWDDRTGHLSGVIPSQYWWDIPWEHLIRCSNFTWDNWDWLVYNWIYIYILILMGKCSQKWDAIDIIGMACILHGIFPNILYQPWLRLGCWGCGQDPGCQKWDP